MPAYKSASTVWSKITKPFARNGSVKSFNVTSGGKRFVGTKERKADLRSGAADVFFSVQGDQIADLRIHQSPLPNRLARFSHTSSLGNMQEERSAKR